MSDGGSDVAELGERARAAAVILAQASRAAKDAALEAMADALAKAETDVLEANAADVERAEGNGTGAALIDRLRLTPDRIGGMVDGPRDDALEARHGVRGEPHRRRCGCRRNGAVVLPRPASRAATPRLRPRDPRRLPPPRT